MTCEQVKPFGGEMECTNSAEIKSLRAQLSALTEERDSHREALEEIYSLPMDKKTITLNAVSVRGIINYALSLSPLPEREAEREVIRLALIWLEAIETLNPQPGYSHLGAVGKVLDAVRHLRTLKKG